MQIKKDIFQFPQIKLGVIMACIVVLGLLLGGGLYAYEMSQTVRHRATIAQVNSYREAKDTFKTMYGALPGDLQDVKRLAGWEHNSRGGNGNGIVGTGFVLQEIEGREAWCHLEVYTEAPSQCDIRKNGLMEYGGADGSESSQFWLHLVLAKLIPENSITATPNAFLDEVHPLAKIAGVWGVSYFQKAFGDFPKGHALNLLVPPLAYANDQHLKVLMAKDAQIIDEKMDDGNPRKGLVIAEDPASGCIVNDNYAPQKGRARTCNMYFNIE